MFSVRRTSGAMPDGEFEPITRAALEASVPACFERQVQRHPTRVALATTGETVTYAELNRLANTVARRILPGAVPSRRPVATLLDPGTAGIAAFLGVLKTGSPVVPLDCNWSKDRLAWILEHSHAEAILTSPIRAGLAATLVQAGQRVIVLPGAADTPDVPNPDGTIRPDDLAVILYTSGSTGRPKGVLDSHRNLLHETLRLTRSLRLTADDRQTLVRANCAGAISDTCTALLNGAALLPYDPLTADKILSWTRTE